MIPGKRRDGLRRWTEVSIEIPCTVYCIVRLEIDVAVLVVGDEIKQPPVTFVTFVTGKGEKTSIAKKSKGWREMAGAYKILYISDEELQDSR